MMRTCKALDSDMLMVDWSTSLSKAGPMSGLRCSISDNASATESVHGRSTEVSIVVDVLLYLLGGLTWLTILPRRPRQDVECLCPFIP